MAKKPATGAETTPATRVEQPIILIRGFGGLGVEDEKKIAYQGFNDGTVYPQKSGENYIYEGLILRFMKSRWIYNDATNIVGYYNSPVIRDKKSIPPELAGFDHNLFSGHKVVIDPATALEPRQVDDRRVQDPMGFPLLRPGRSRRLQTLWHRARAPHHVHPRRWPSTSIRPVPKVNIIAHSMGGLIVREAVQRSYASGEAAQSTSTRSSRSGPRTRASRSRFSRTGSGSAQPRSWSSSILTGRKIPKNPVGFNKFAEHFPPERVLTVVGTNYRTYGPAVASWLNRAFSVAGEFGPNYNRSDGLVKQAFAQLPGAPRTFVHKCHGGPDSLVTSREAFEVATRFFFGNIKVRLKLVKAKVKRGKDLFGKSEFFFGVSASSRAASTSSCSTRAPRPRTATGPSARRT